MIVIRHDLPAANLCDNPHLYALWKLLEPEVLSTYEAFQDYPRERRQLHFIRRTKEEMLYLDGQRMYPKRDSDTLGYDLTQGPVSEQSIYDETTEYLRYVYNKAKMLNRSAARLAMSVFQRRLASSTFALLRSFERRSDKLRDLIAQIQDGHLTIEQIITMQRRIREDEDVFDAETADEETAESDREQNEVAEEKLLQGVVAASLTDLQLELDQVQHLRSLAKRVYEAGTESKFERLREVLADPKFAEQKLILFTEHRDTMEFLVRRLEGMGYTGQVAQIHGGMYYTKREEQVERFRKPAESGGARFLVCTDAAGEGINLQFCWIMINYDIPWNPARLEQRMGRIHRYGQKHDPVVILNLVAPKTREGRVLQTLLDKLEKIREQLQSDKVFDVIGRLFEGLSIKQYMEMALAEDGTYEATRELEGRLTKEQVEAIFARERSLYGGGGDVAKMLPRLRDDLDREMYQRLLPGYVRQYFENASSAGRHRAGRRSRWLLFVAVRQRHSS
jgi:SNF2 family DNA or RNA helicase